jgi:uncharacterized protein (DUF2336 family)
MNSFNHLHAIACRKQISETVTDALVDREHLNAIRMAVNNVAACFSEVPTDASAPRALRNCAHVFAALVIRKAASSRTRPRVFFGAS